jgi:putative restriction endonuclease
MIFVLIKSHLVKGVIAVSDIERPTVGLYRTLNNEWFIPDNGILYPVEGPSANLPTKVRKRRRSQTSIQQAAPARQPVGATMLRRIAGRRGQAAFRNRLLKKYGNRCVVTGCTITDMLEAAHIKEHSNRGGFGVDNGLLLRCDIHTMFDLNLLCIDPDSLRVVLRESCRIPPYVVYHTRPVNIPNVNLDYLRQRFEGFNKGI